MLKIIKDKRFINVLKFSKMYRFIMQLLITPILLYFGKVLLKYHHVQFMSSETMMHLLTKLSVLIFIIVGLGMMMFLLMLELSSTIVLSEYEDATETLLPYTMKKLSWTLKPKNLVFLPVLMVVMLGFHFGLSSVITESFFIPEFIMDTIIKTSMYMTLYTAVTAVAFVIAFHLVFMFHNLFIAEKTMKRSIVDNIIMVNSNRINFLMDAIKLGIEVSVVSAIVYLVTIFSIAGILYLLPPFLSLGSVSISILFMINKGSLLVLISSISAVNVVFITKKYREYGGMIIEHHSIENINIHKVFTSPKYALTLLMLVTLIIQGFGAYKTTQTFDSPDFLDHKIYITSHRGNSSVAP